jgi:hypothetical protein
MIQESKSFPIRRPYMRFYTNQHKFYCGIDLHARTMYLCILNQEGKKRERSISTESVFCEIETGPGEPVASNWRIPISRDETDL